MTLISRKDGRGRQQKESNGSAISPEIALAGETSFAEEDTIAERIKIEARARRLRAARALASRMQTAPDGSRVFVRFTQSERLEHQFLLVTFTLLAITGLLQRYSAISSVGWTINTVFGSVETLRTLHHLAAVILIFEAAYHLVRILNVWFVQRKRGSMWPYWQDLRDLLQMLKYNLGLRQHKPEFDRFSVEEKIEYWALLWGTAIMVLTGLFQWFPTWITQILSGEAIPVSRAIHGWEAVLATLAILIWHLYHTVIKEKNKSIFTGLMSEKEMREGHAIEYRRILAASRYLEKMKGNKKVVEAGVKHTRVQESQAD